MTVHYTKKKRMNFTSCNQTRDTIPSVQPFTLNDTEESPSQDFFKNFYQPSKAGQAFLCPKHPFRLAAFNVRTLRQIGQQAALAQTLEGLEVDVCCLSETRLYDSTSIIPLRVPSPSSNVTYHLRCSGDIAASTSGTAGVGVALSSRAEAALLDWIPINSRLCAVRLAGSCKVNSRRDTKRSLFVVSAYAPTNCSTDALKDEFYAQLTDLLRRAPRTDIVILAGDLNACIGRLSPDETQLGGSNGHDSHRNDNGERVLHVCSDHRLFLTSLNFRHRKRHLATWRPPTANQHWKQIDHIAISSRWRGSVNDCRSYWSSSVDSDHAIVCAKLSMRFCGQRYRRSKRIDCTKLLHQPTVESFQRDLASKLDSPPDCVDEHWLHISNTLHRVATEVCGVAKPKNNPWISAQSLGLLNCRRTLSTDHTHDAERRTIRRQLSRSLQNDRKAWWNARAQEMEAAWAMGDSHRLFQVIKAVSPRRPGVSETVSEIDGHPITSINRRMDRWMEHFNAQFNWPPLSSTVAAPFEAVPWLVNTDAPTVDEVNAAIRGLKNRKSPGDDDLPAELFKSGGSALLQQLTNLFTKIWASECVPTCWSTSIIVPIYKKGSRTDCSNHRGISLISVASKLLVTIILHRLSTTRELLSREEQAGFRRGRGCVDQIFTLRQLLEHRHMYQRPTIVVFLDIRAAFDSVDRKALWDYLIQSGVPAKFVTILKALYNETEGRVRVYNQLSQPFSITSGVRQGCPISPFLFNFVIDDILKTALSRTTGGVELLPGSKVLGLDYADDIVLIGDDLQSMQNTLDCLTPEVNRYGMVFSPTKCKILTQDWFGPSIILSLAGATLEVVQHFPYLGSQISADGSITAEITSRINKARGAFKNLQHLWRRRDISLSLKGRVYSAAVRSTLLYGCEAWSLRSEDLRRLTVFDHRCLRSISHVWWEQRVSNADVRRRIFHGHNTAELKDLINSHRLRWLGHVLRMSPQRLPRRTLFATPGEGWKKRRGGQTSTWRRNMKALTTRLSKVGSCRLPGWGPKDEDCVWLETLAGMANDRTQWRTCSTFLIP